MRRLMDRLPIRQLRRDLPSYNRRNARRRSSHRYRMVRSRRGPNLAPHGLLPRRRMGGGVECRYIFGQRNRRNPCR
jgi:hypothetical protein